MAFLVIVEANYLAEVLLLAFVSGQGSVNSNCWSTASVIICGAVAPFSMASFSILGLGLVFFQLSLTQLTSTLA